MPYFLRERKYTLNQQQIQTRLKSYKLQNRGVRNRIPDDPVVNKYEVQ